MPCSVLNLIADRQFVLSLLSTFTKLDTITEKKNQTFKIVKPHLICFFRFSSCASIITCGLPVFLLLRGVPCCDIFFKHPVWINEVFLVATDHFHRFSSSSYNRIIVFRQLPVSNFRANSICTGRIDKLWLNNTVGCHFCAKIQLWNGQSNLLQNLQKLLNEQAFL